MPSNPQRLKYTGEALRASEFIWKHFREPLSVSVIATSLHISKSHLEKCFKLVLGISVGAYIRAIRVYHVLSTLESTHNRSMLDIAFERGFNSSSGFYKAYKTATGQCPKRNLHKKRHPADVFLSSNLIINGVI